MSEQELTAEDQYFKSNFNTNLDDDQTKAYAQWIAKESSRIGRNLANDNIDYDLQGAFKKYGENVFSAENGHAGDEFKKPNHPTFSDQSIYHNTDNGVGGKYVGGTWKTSKDGLTAYQPSVEMLSTTHDPSYMIDYFKNTEPDAVLMLPKTTE